MSYGTRLRALVHRQGWFMVWCSILFNACLLALHWYRGRIDSLEEGIVQFLGMTVFLSLLLTFTLAVVYRGPGRSRS